MSSDYTPWKILSSTLSAGVLTEGWTLADVSTGQEEESRYFFLPVLFATPFAASPVVHLGLTGFDMDQRDSSRLSVKAIDITAEGFTVAVSTWRWSRVYGVELGWLAIGA